MLPRNDASARISLRGLRIRATHDFSEIVNPKPLLSLSPLNTPISIMVYVCAVATTAVVKTSVAHTPAIMLFIEAPKLVDVASVCHQAKGCKHSLVQYSAM